MNYQWHYNRLIATRRNRVLVEGVYYERHHVLPRSMGGTNDSTNIVKLTAREHFLAHWLLWRIHRNTKMAHAFNAMCMKNSLHQRIESSRAYAEAREAFSRSQSENNVPSKARWSKLDSSERSKVVSSMNQKIWSALTEEQKSSKAREIWSKRRKYVRQCPNCNADMLYSNPETLKKCEEKKTLCVSCHASKDTLLECTHCKVKGKGNTMKRWHFENCKMKES